MSSMSSFRVAWTGSSLRNIFSSPTSNFNAAIVYIAQHKEKIERDYAEIVRRSEARQAYYEQMYRERSRFPPDMPLEERAMILRQILLNKTASSSNRKMGSA